MWGCAGWSATTEDRFSHVESHMMEKCLKEKMLKNKHLIHLNGRNESFDCGYTDNFTVRTTCFAGFLHVQMQ